MPIQLQRKEILGPLAQQAVVLSDPQAHHEPAPSAHPLAQLVPGTKPLIAQPRLAHSPEEAEQKATRTDTVAQALSQVSAAYADGHGAQQAVAMLSDKGQQIPTALHRAEVAEKRAAHPVRAKAGGEVASSNPLQDSQPAEQSPQQQIYTALYPTLLCTGITNTQEDARRAAGVLTGVADDNHGLAAYGSQAPTGMAADARAVTHYAALGDLVNINESGQVVYDTERLEQNVSTLGFFGIGAINYQPPLELGRSGADRLINQMTQTGQPPDPSQFISVQGHSGGGQSAFFTLVELHQRGYTNLSLVGYEMALTPHQREVLEQLGVPVTNISGHNNGNLSDVGSTIRQTMGGGENYYDVHMDRTGEGDGEIYNISQHNLVLNGGQTGQVAENAQRVQAMVQFSTWLDSQGLHQQWTPENLAAFEQATGYTAPVSPLSGTNLYRAEDGGLQNQPRIVEAPALPG